MMLSQYKSLFLQLKWPKIAGGIKIYTDLVMAFCPGGRGQSSKVPLRTMASNSHFIAASHSVLADETRTSLRVVGSGVW